MQPVSHRIRPSYNTHTIIQPPGTLWPSTLVFHSLEGLVPQFVGLDPESAAPSHASLHTVSDESQGYSAHAKCHTDNTPASLDPLSNQTHLPHHHHHLLPSMTNRYLMMLPLLLPIQHYLTHDDLLLLLQPLSYPYNQHCGPQAYRTSQTYAHNHRMLASSYYMHSVPWYCMPPPGSVAIVIQSTTVPFM